MEWAEEWGEIPESKKADAVGIHCNRLLCDFCGKHMDSNNVGYYGVELTSGKKGNYHIGCAERTTDVIRIEAKGTGSAYYDIDPPALTDLLDGAEYGDGYIITKEKMTILKYNTLPEFQGF